MILRSLLLHHFRSYIQKKFDFLDALTIVVGPNTAGKTNLAESISLLLTGKSFKTSTDAQMISFGQDVGRVQGLLVQDNEKTKTEVVLASPEATGGRFSKKFLINGVAKSRNAIRDFLPLILFRPEELDIIIDGPSLRRSFLDDVLEQVDKQYYAAKTAYERSLRQRNALLRLAQETGRRNDEQFAYWDDFLIENGQIITKKREEFLEFINNSVQDIFPITVTYDASTISRERLDQYRDAEVGAGVTLVGPHRDDFFVSIQVQNSNRDIRHFGSRGQQRLAILQLKMLQISYVKEKLHALPLFILDDIFSELDSGHINLVLNKVKGMQVILTTTHREFVPKQLAEQAVVIELEK